MSKVRVAIAGTIGKSIQFDPNAGARAEAAVAALAAQISAGLGGSIRHSSLQGLQIGDDHPQYTGNQFPETITGQWNFQTIPFIQGETLAEYIEDVVGGSFFDFLQDTPSVVWTYHDTAQELEANVPPEFVQDTVGAMLTDSTSIDFTYNDPAGTFTAVIIDEYVQDLVGAMLVDTSTVDFTYDDPTGKISAVVPGAALTKTDDTNVTLTLGGSPTTALARAASLTLGWTGQLSVPRGGSGAATLTGYLKGNGAAAFTAVSTIPYSDISGTPSIPAGANPTASVGLSAVNGSASTWMRSDGAPALNQGIAPTWTASHLWNAVWAGGVPGTVALRSSGPVFELANTGAAVDQKNYFVYPTTTGFNFDFRSDDYATSRLAFSFQRSGVACTEILFGNATDNTQCTFQGAGNLKFGATGTGTQVATFAAANKPGSGTAGVISWVPVLTAGGTQGYIPIFGA